MKLSEAIATAETLFVKPLLLAKTTKKDSEIEDSIKNLDKIEIEDKKEYETNKRFYKKQNKKLYRRFRIRG